MNVYCLNGSSMFSWQSRRKKEDCFVPRNDETRRLLRSSKLRRGGGKYNTHNNFYKHLLYVIKLLHYAF